MGGIIGFAKKILIGGDRDELALSGTYKAMLKDALAMNKALMEENLALREGTKTSPWDIAGQFLQLPPETQGALIKQIPAILQGALAGDKKGLNIP